MIRKKIFLHNFNKIYIKCDNCVNILSPSDNWVVTKRKMFLIKCYDTFLWHLGCRGFMAPDTQQKIWGGTQLEDQKMKGWWDILFMGKLGNILTMNTRILQVNQEMWDWVWLWMNLTHLEIWACHIALASCIDNLQFVTMGLYERIIIYAHFVDS